MLVCYDATFPETCRVLSLKGAEIICAIFNGPKWLPDDRFVYLASTRACENRNYFILCNRVGEEDIEFSGKSVIAAPDGQIVSQSNGDTEEVVYATLYEDRILEERAFQPIFRDRRPELYEAIIERF
jgi:predicted amidohydrolase